MSDEEKTVEYRYGITKDIVLRIKELQAEMLHQVQCINQAKEMFGEGVSSFRTCGGEMCDLLSELIKRAEIDSRNAKPALSGQSEI